MRPVGRGPAGLDEAGVDVVIGCVAVSGLPEREPVGLGAGLEKGDLQRPLAYRVAPAHELVEAAVLKQAVPVLVDIHAM